MDAHPDSRGGTQLVWHGGSKLYSLDQRRWKVLVAHSDPPTLALVSAAFRRDGYRVFDCSDGVRASEHIGALDPSRNPSDRLALVVAEVDLPQRSGIELLSLLRAQGSFVPVVLLSRRPAPEASAVAFATSHATIFEGPFYLTDLLTAASLMLSAASRRGSSENSRPPRPGVSPPVESRPEISPRGERRLSRRVPVSLVVVERVGRLSAVQRCTNLSTAGLFILSTISPGSGRSIQRRFTLPDDGASISSEGEVVRRGVSEGVPGYGVRFLHISAMARGRIERFVERRR